MKPDVLILGGGAAGLSSAWHLSRAGARVLLLEAEPQFGVHSSGQNAAILRTLTNSPLVTRLTRKAAQSLHRPPEGFCELPLVDPIGLVLTADSTLAADLLSWQQAAGPAPYPECAGHPIDGAEIARLVPPYRHPDNGQAMGLHFPGEGQIDIALLLDSFAKGARLAGAELRTSCPVQELLLDQTASAPRVTGVRLVSGELIHCDRVLLAAGAWAGKLAAQAGSPLKFFPRRRHLCVTRGKSVVNPQTPIVWNHGEAAKGRTFYMRPESGGVLLCACDETLLEPSSNFPQGVCPRDEAVLEDVARAAELFAPELADAEVVSWWSGWRTFTEDHHFALGPDPKVVGLHWCAGLGGHGMTASFEAGRLAAASASKGLHSVDRAVLEGDDYEGLFTPSSPKQLA